MKCEIRITLLLYANSNSVYIIATEMLVIKINIAIMLYYIVDSSSQLYDLYPK